MPHSFSRALLLGALAAAGLVATPASAQSVVYCCDDASGKKVCGDFLPKECQGRAYQERDGLGFVIKDVPAPLTPAQIAQREAEQKRKEEAEQKRIEERRRNLALLSTYADERDIDVARDRELADVDKLMAQAEKVLADSTARRAKLDKEREFYKTKILPAQLKEQMAAADKDVATKKAAVNDRLAQRQAVIDKFAQEKRRYRELKRGGTGEDPSTPKREVVVQPNEGAASEVRPDSGTAPAPAPPAEEPRRPGNEGV